MEKLQCAITHHATSITILTMAPINIRCWSTWRQDGPSQLYIAVLSNYSNKLMKLGTLTNAGLHHCVEGVQ